MTCGSCFCNSFQVQYLKDVFNPQFIRKIEAKGKRGIQLPQNDLWTLPLVVFSWPSQLLFNSENSCLFCCLIKYIPTFWEKQLINNFNLPPPPNYYFSPIMVPFLRNWIGRHFSQNGHSEIWVIKGTYYDTNWHEKLTHN